MSVQNSVTARSRIMVLQLGAGLTPLEMSGQHRNITLFTHYMSISIYVLMCSGKGTGKYVLFAKQMNFGHENMSRINYKQYY